MRVYLDAGNLTINHDMATRTLTFACAAVVAAILALLSQAKCGTTNNPSDLVIRIMTMYDPGSAADALAGKEGAST